MENRMRIAHISDLHFCMKYLEEVQRCTAYAVNQAIDRVVDIMVISGDATECGLDMHSPAAHALLAVVRRLTDHCPVLMLQGTYSHEPPGTLNVFRHLGGRYPVYGADSIRQVALVSTADGARWVESDGWRFDALPINARVIVSCLPAVNKGAVAAVAGADEASIAVGRNVAAVLAGFGISNAIAREHGIPTLGVSHGTVTGCVTEHGVPMAGLDHEFSTESLFAAQCSGFALGHIHCHQEWRDSYRVIAYPGSIGRLHYGEEGEKGFLIWDMDSNGARLEFIPTPARRMLHVEFEGKPDLAHLQNIAAQAGGAFIRVRWQIPEEERLQVDRSQIMAILNSCGGAKLEETIIPTHRARLPGLSEADSVAAKVKLWAISMGIGPDPLVSRLDRLAYVSPEVIVDQIVDEAVLATGILPEHAAADEPSPLEIQH